MDFIRFNPTNTARRIVSDKPYINLILKSGVIYFNRAAEEIFELKKGTQIEFLQSPADAKEWYLAIGSSQGFELKERHAGGVMISSRAVVTLVARSLNLTDNGTIKIPIAKEIDSEVNAFALITSAISK
jgi:hypothetical protein